MELGFFYFLFFMAFSCRGGALLRDHTGTHPCLRGGMGLGELREANWAGLAEPQGPRATWGSYLLYSTLLGVELELVLAENKCGVTKSSCSTTGRQPGWLLCVCGWDTICDVG